MRFRRKHLGLTVGIAVIVASAVYAPSYLSESLAQQTMDVEIGVFPDEPLLIYEADPARHRNDVVLHGLGITNNSADDLTVIRISFHLMQDDQVLQSRFVEADAISRMARQYRMAQQMGTFRRFDSVFGFSRLFGAQGRLSGAATLGPERSLILFSQYFSFSGTADELRVEVRLEDGAGTAGTVSHVVAIESYTSPNTFRFPLQGAWRVDTGPNHYGHHRWSQNSEFAIDVIRVSEDGRAFIGEGQVLEDFLSYGAPVLAAAAGVVVAAEDGIGPAPLKAPDETFDVFFNRMSDRQTQMFGEDPELASGNYVIIEHEGGEYSVYGHLRQGSVSVQSGDRIGAGEQIGEIGNSGNSLEPHLHFHVMLGADRMWSRGVPVVFENLAGRSSDRLNRQLRSGDIVFSLD